MLDQTQLLGAACPARGQGTGCSARAHLVTIFWLTHEKNFPIFTLLKKKSLSIKFAYHEEL